MSNEYMITTQRLGLRLLAKEDITYLYPLEGDPEVKAFFPDGALDRAKTEEMDDLQDRYGKRHQV